MPEFLKFAQGFFNLNLMRKADSEAEYCTIVFKSGDEYSLHGRATDWIQKLLDLRADSSDQIIPLSMEMSDFQLIEISDTKCLGFRRQRMISPR